MPNKLAAGQPVRWGILGAGGIAAKVGADIQASAGSDIVAVAARSTERAKMFAELLGVPRHYGSYAELVADPEIDVVYVATTHPQHHELALLALKADKPVLVEKPFTVNARQAEEVIAEARSRDLFCMEAMWMRTNPLVRQAQDLVTGGAIGTVLSVTADHGQRFNYDPAHRLFDMAVGGGALLDLGVYSATFAWMFLGRPEQVQTTGALSPTGSDLTTAMQWSYPDDRFAQVSCTTESATPCVGLVVGTDGWVSLQRPFYIPHTLTVHNGSEERIIRQFLPGHGFGPEITEVEHCLREGLPESPLLPLDDTLGIIRVLDDARATLGLRYAGE